MGIFAASFVFYGESLYPMCSERSECAAENMDPPPTPETEEEFNPEWVKHVMKGFFEREDKDLDKVVIKDVRAKKNSVQGILSTTFVVDVDFEYDGEQQECKSIFVKVPLKDDPNFKSVNDRELAMFTNVLPKLQTFLDVNCDGFFKLPMPERIHCFYDGTGTNDVFVFENLLASEFENFSNDRLNDEHMKSIIECLCQLHGSGFAYKHKLGGRKEFLEAFPGLEEQIQLKDLVETEQMKERVRKLFRPFLHYLETVEPALRGHTQYMKKMKRLVVKIIKVLEDCGYEHLLTLCHGDAKPNNFMFRRHTIDIEDLECEGLEAILIDWQGGFVGSVANDLMWALYPFLETMPKDTLNVALEYYFDNLKIVLESFGLTLSDLQLPEDFSDFSSLLRKSLVLEFIIVTVIKPILCVENPRKLLNWYKTGLRNERYRFKKSNPLPDVTDVFQSPRFPGFCHLYFKIATAVGGFQELGRIYFDVMREFMFDEERAKSPELADSDDEADDGWIEKIRRNLPQEYPKPFVFAATTGVVALCIALIMKFCM